MSRAAAAAVAAAGGSGHDQFPNTVIHPPPPHGLIGGDGTNRSEAAWFDFLLQAIRPPDAAAADDGVFDGECGHNVTSGVGVERPLAASLPAMPEMVLQQIAIYLAVPDLIR